jgi:hypothetical protein
VIRRWTLISNSDANDSWATINFRRFFRLVNFFDLIHSFFGFGSVCYQVFKGGFGLVVGVGVISSH